MITATTTTTIKTSTPSLRTAVELKEAIEAIPNSQASIGSQVLVEWDWYNEHACYAKKDGVHTNIQPEVYKANKALSKQFRSLKKLAKAKTTSFKKDWCMRLGSSNPMLTIPGFKHGKPFDMYLLKSRDLKELYENHSEPSPFGDQKALKTSYDPKVRKGRQITQDNFGVSGNVLEAVQKTWVKHFSPGGACRAEAYKINLYGKGDFFSAHKDTPAKGLIGTFLMGLGEDADSCDFEGLQVTDKEGKVETWHSKCESWCAFYPDCLHEVPIMPYGHRANIAFKIYQVRGPDDDISLAQKIAKQLTSMLAGEDQFGLVLSHDYSVNETAFKGVDNAFVQAVKLLPEVAYEIVPILIKQEASWPYPEGYNSYSDYAFGSDVYSVRPEDVAYALNGDSLDQPEALVEDEVNFYAINDKGPAYCWKKHMVDDVASTGNESRPGEQDSIYMHRAIVVTQWLQGEAAHKKSKHCT